MSKTISLRLSATIVKALEQKALMSGMGKTELATMIFQAGLKSLEVMARAEQARQQEEKEETNEVGHIGHS